MWSRPSGLVSSSLSSSPQHCGSLQHMRQWSMDETQTWFDSLARRSSSLERANAMAPLANTATSQGRDSNRPFSGLFSAEIKRKLFLKKTGTGSQSAPAPKTNDDNNNNNNNNGNNGGSGGNSSNVRFDDMRQMESKATPTHLGLSQGREGLLSPGQPIMSLPSPNVVSINTSMPTLLHNRNIEDEPAPRPQPPSPRPELLRLERRGALVPSDISEPDIDLDEDNDDSNVENGHKESRDRSYESCGETRRGSMVVIPAMSVCPGDLLVYSKNLAAPPRMPENASSHSLGTGLTGTEPMATAATSSNAATSANTATATTTNSTSGGTARRHKGSWSLLKLFDKGARGLRSGISMDAGVDAAAVVTDALAAMTPSEFTDETLTRLLGVHYTDFVELRPKLGKNSKLQRAMSEHVSPEESPNTKSASNSGLSASIRRKTHLVHSMTFTAKDLDPRTRFLTARETLSAQERRRKEAVWDLLQSELYFLIDHLMVLKHVYMEPLKRMQVEGFLMFAEPELLFGNLDELCTLAHGYCREFVHLLTQLSSSSSSSVTSLLARLFQRPGSRASSLAEASHCYALNYINALNYLDSLRRHADFVDFEKFCNRDPRCKKLQLPDLLVSPVHHIMKVPIILKDVLNRTEDPDQKAVVATILDAKEASLRDLDDKMKWLKNFDRLLEIQRLLVWPSVLEMETKHLVPDFLRPALQRQPCERILASPRRQIIMESRLFMLMEHAKPIEAHLVLCDDLLLITKRKKAIIKKKSSLSSDLTCPSSPAATTSSLSGFSSSSSSPLSNSDLGWRYVVHRQPLSLDRFFIHDVSANEAGGKLDFAFVIICLNRFQQIIQVYTFQAETEELKATWLQRLREAQEAWRQTLQLSVFKNGL